ncbi:MAG TPA: hypothetical protein VEV41_04190 [Terriglobales bacterium]|nr:hypothetical protein [Terriglobales bacterium]
MSIKKLVSLQASSRQFLLRNKPHGDVGLHGDAGCAEPMPVEGGLRREVGRSQPPLTDNLGTIAVQPVNVESPPNFQQ